MYPSSLERRWSFLMRYKNARKLSTVLNISLRMHLKIMSSQLGACWVSLCRGVDLGWVDTMVSPWRYNKGKVRIMRMYPITFREFLRAADQRTFNFIEELRGIQHLPEIIFNKLKTEYRRYLVCGGMPEAVISLLDNQGMATVENVQQDILELYELDFAKYADSKETLASKRMLASANIKCRKFKSEKDEIVLDFDR